MRGIELSKDYLDSQIKIYKNKSSLSLKKAQEYSMEQDLTIFDFYSKNKSNFINQNNLKNDTISNIGIEKIRVDAANDIRNIDSKIKKINELSKNNNQIEYINLITPEMSSDNLIKELNKLDLNLIDAKYKYKISSRYIKALELQRKSLLNKLKDQSIEYLRAQRIIAEAKMESSNRPKGVFLKYKELIREAARDEKTLIDLENQLRIIKLGESRIEDPWTLITKPTIQKYPISPIKKNYGLFGIFCGFIIGNIFSFYKEKKSKKIFEESYLERLLELKIIKRMKLKEKNIEENPYEFSFKQIINTKGEKINILLTNNLNHNGGKIKKYISNKLAENSGPEKNIELYINKELNIENLTEDFLLFISLKSLSIEEIKNLKKKIDKFKINLEGIIFVE